MLKIRKKIKLDLILFIFKINFLIFGSGTTALWLKNHCKFFAIIFKYNCSQTVLGIGSQSVKPQGRCKCDINKNKSIMFCYIQALNFFRFYSYVTSSIYNMPFITLCPTNLPMYFASYCNRYIESICDCASRISLPGSSITQETQQRGVKVK